jgi:hypothetical protein
VQEVRVGTPVAGFDQVVGGAVGGADELLPDDLAGIGNGIVRVRLIDPATGPPGSKFPLHSDGRETAVSATAARTDD